MKYKLTKFYLKGPKKDSEEDFFLSFPSLESADKWCNDISDDPKTDFVIVMYKPALWGEV